ncbi:MAG: hypothetical protein JSW04_13920 [Desulfobacterales bacterium]|nr:MAG: hypothetical protein JSW04_13920 [Desulfobacterales bacterium]
MKKIITQIYETQTPVEAEQLIAIGVDHIGSVVISKVEWKLQSLKETMECIADATAKSSLIPLFSNLDIILRTLEYYQPDMVHFCEDLMLQNRVHGNCDHLLTLQEDVKKRFPEIKIMRSIPIAQPGMAQQVPTHELARLFQPFSDYFLTDTMLIKGDKDPFQQQPVEGFVGITGLTCDWNVAAELVKSGQIPVILAGGLAPDNVYDGILSVHPAGVDSCTGTNAVDSVGRSVRFKKDLEKVKQFIDETRRAEGVILNRQQRAHSP